MAKTFKEEIAYLKKLRQRYYKIKIRKIIRLPGSMIARMLGIRCPNCGADTLSELLWNCTHCGHPSPSRLECPNCGLHMTHTDMGSCPKCGVAIGALQSPSSADDSPLKIDEIPEITPANNPTIEQISSAETAARLASEEIKPVEKVEIADPPPPPDAEIISNPMPVALPAIKPVIENKPPPNIDIHEVIELPPPQPKEIPVVGEDFSISVEQLADIFKIDIAKADGIYKEKVLRVKGTIETVALDDPENHYIILGGYHPSQEQKVQCIFDKKYEPVLTRLIPGQRITVLGRYNGYDTYIRLMDSLPVA